MAPPPAAAAAAARRSITWFPGHMASAMAALSRVIPNIDLLLEVRDARIPLSSANPKLTSLAGRCSRHLVVLNKADLVKQGARQAALEMLQRQGLRAMAASCGTPAGAQPVLQEAVSWLAAERAAASDLSVMMVVGLPNSGKSSLINALKLAANTEGSLGGQQTYRKKAAAGATPGLTRQVAGFQVSAGPDVYVLDTPGIMVPAVPSDDVGMRLALAGAIKDAVVGHEAIATYLLHLLATQPRHRAALRHSAGSGGSRQRGDKQLAMMRSALMKAADYQPAMPGAAGAAAAAGLAPDSALLGPDNMLAAAAAAADWQPGDGDDDEDDGDELGEGSSSSRDVDAWRLELLLRGLGVAGARNPNQQTGALARVLAAWRAGQLGKYCLDDVWQAGDGKQQREGRRQRNS